MWANFCKIVSLDLAEVIPVEGIDQSVRFFHRKCHKVSDKSETNTFYWA